MFRCIQLAKNGLGTTYPNPLVGSVVVQNNKIIGEGWHYKAGLPHAEVNAIMSVSYVNLLKDSTIYVSLEPCSHFGKTPPCADLIIESGIKKVVIGNIDPNPKVAGKGIKKLLDSGCEVLIGILENECTELNKRFFTFHSKKRPYIILKWAETADGFISPEESLSQSEMISEKKPFWVTNEFSRQRAHKMRAQEQAILVGTNTVLADNPSLTTRDWGGTYPVRVVLDRSLKIPKDSAIYIKETKTIVITEKETSNNGNIYFEKIDFQKNLALGICDVLYNHEIQSVIIEGGTQTLQTFIDANIWDEAFVFSSLSTFKKGTKAPVFSGLFISETQIKTDMLKIYNNENP